MLETGWDILKSPIIIVECLSKIRTEMRKEVEELLRYRNFDRSEGGRGKGKGLLQRRR